MITYSHVCNETFSLTVQPMWHLSSTSHQLFEGHDAPTPTPFTVAGEILNISMTKYLFVVLQI